MSSGFPMKSSPLGIEPTKSHKAMTQYVAHLSMKSARNTMGPMGNPKVIVMTCDAIGERAQVILVWVRVPGVENGSHPQRLGVTRVRP